MAKSPSAEKLKALVSLIDARIDAKGAKKTPAPKGKGLMDSITEALFGPDDDEAEDDDADEEDAS